MNMCMTKIYQNKHFGSLRVPEFPVFLRPFREFGFRFFSKLSRRIYFRFRACDAMMCSLLANARNGVHRFCGILIWLPPSRL